MKKKIIAAAIAAALVAPVAQAEMKVSGRIGGEVVNMPAAAGGLTFTDGNGHTRLQLDWTDGDMFARYALDLSLAAGPAFRDYFIGMKLGNGKLSAGKMAGAVANLEDDKYIATFLQLRGKAVFNSNGVQGYNSNGFIVGVVEYAMKVNDIDVKVQYIPFDTPNAIVPPVGPGDKGHIGIGVKGKAGDIGYYFGWNNGDTTANNTTMKAGASMKFGEITAKLDYNQHLNAPARFAIGAEMSLSDGMSVDFTYGDKGNLNTKAFMRLAVSKKMGEQSSIYAGYADNGHMDQAGVFGVGAVVKF